MDEENMFMRRDMIAKHAHAKVGKQVRIKLKRFISQLKVPEVIETMILNYIGMVPYKMYRGVWFKKDNIWTMAIYGKDKIIKYN